MKLNFRAILDQNQSVILNLALGDPEARRLLGCLLTVSAETAGLSRADVPPEQRLSSHHLILDEFSEFTAQSEESLARMLALSRKYRLLQVLAHQTWSQTSERLRGALQNVGMEVVFRLGRRDAEYTAPLLGRADLLKVKHEVADKTAVGRTHPLLYSLQEHWELWVQDIQSLRPREAFLKKPDGTVVRMRTLSVNDPTVSLEKIAQVEAYYLSHYFRPKADIERAFAPFRNPPRPFTTRIRSLTEEDRPSVDRRLIG